MAVALLCAGLPALRAEAQLTPRSAAVIGGIESRSYQFAAPLPIRRITQVAIPVGAVATFGRLSLDLGTYWAATSLTRQDNRFRRVTGFTDTQARVAWTFGRDLGVASLVLNLPTGLAPMNGTAQLNDVQATELMQGRWYVVLRTPAFPDGEIRAQLMPVL